MAKVKAKSKAKVQRKEKVKISPTQLVEHSRAKGTLVIIGGHEDKSGSKKILCEIAGRVGKGPLVVATVASDAADELWPEYRKAFKALGVTKLSHLNINSRAEALDQKNAGLVRDAKGVFFTGGDQLKIPSEIGGTEICKLLHALYDQGGVIAGTSAGASAMSAAMILSGPGETSVRVRGDVTLAPGLDLTPELVIDQHFSQRGRLSRLIGALALNPRYLGVGIDEDTAIVIDHPDRFRITGSGSVYILDAQDTDRINISESGVNPECTLSAHNLRLFVLCDGEVFSIKDRKPIYKPK